MDESSSNTLAEMAEAVAKAKNILASSPLPSDPRTFMELEIFSDMIREHEAMLQSCTKCDYHSVIQHSRRIMERLYQGIWHSRCATDSQIANHDVKQVFPNSAFRMAQEIDGSCRANGQFKEMRKHIWSILGRFANFELEEVGRRKTQCGIEPPYRDEEIEYMVITCTQCVLLVAEDLLRIRGFHEKSIEIEVILRAAAS